MCASKVYTNAEYVDTFCRLLGLCGLPFLKEKASDENTYSPQMIEVLTTLGQLVCGDSEPVRVQVAETVAMLCSKQRNRTVVEGMQYEHKRMYYMYYLYITNSSLQMQKWLPLQSVQH